MIKQVRYWMERAACLQAELKLFFPGNGKAHHLSTQKAKAICGGCDVLNECREHALTNNEFGTWGGLTYPERARLRKERRENAQAGTEEAGGS